MGLSIKSAETERVVRELAAVTGQSLTDAVHAAVVLQLETVRRQRKSPKQRQAELEAYYAEVDARRIPNAPSVAEIEAEMYDDYGLPR